LDSTVKEAGGTGACNGVNESRLVDENLADGHSGCEWHVGFEVHVSSHDLACTCSAKVSCRKGRRVVEESEVCGPDILEVRGDGCGVSAPECAGTGGVELLHDVGDRR